MSSLQRISKAHTSSAEAKRREKAPYARACLRNGRRGGIKCAVSAATMLGEKRFFKPGGSLLTRSIITHRLPRARRRRARRKPLPGRESNETRCAALIITIESFASSMLIICEISKQSSQHNVYMPSRQKRRHAPYICCRSGVARRRPAVTTESVNASSESESNRLIGE